MGNLRSVQKAFERVGADARIITTAAEIRAADKLVLPGVGAFRDAIAHLREQGLADAIVEFAGSGRPFLGICLGLQLLFDVSYEDGEHRGLGILPGQVRRFDFSNVPDAAGLKVPHMGWNQIEWQDECPLLRGVEQGTYFYFVHSYHVVPAETASLGRATSHYGYPFTAAVWRDNLFATQFHPEKSQDAGRKLLENFAAI